MQEYNLLYFPHEALRQVAEPVQEFDTALALIAKKMLATMKEYEGIGLAGNQIGFLKRIFVMQIPDEKQAFEYEPTIFINPTIISKSGQIEYEEGCLSLPGQKALVTRAHQIELAYFDLAGKQQALEADGLKAICIQHEIDHLDGRLFIDHLSSLKRAVIKKKLAKYLKSIK